MSKLWRVPFSLVMAGALLLVAAGTWDLPFFWAYLGVLSAAAVIALGVMNPELVEERLSPGPGGTDRTLRFAMLPFFAAHLVVAGLDVGRFGWSGSLSPALQTGALACLAGGMGLSIYAMRVNRFFSSIVRIQDERGHAVVTAGPYRLVRHPGYVAAILMMLASGPALGSWWSMIAVAPGVALILRRTLIEDRYLQAHLPGYTDYARRVRSRLIPGIW